MPVFRIETNQTLTKNETSALMEKSTEMLCQLFAKPKTFMMIYIDSGCSIMFDGNKDPFAFVQLRQFSFSDDQAPKIIGEISTFIQNEIGVKPNRQYIQLAEMNPKHFGWAGKPC